MKSAHFALLFSTIAAAPTAFPATPPQKSTPAAASSLSPDAPKSAVVPKADVAELNALPAKAERGNAIAQYNLGLAYMDGRQSDADLIEAFVWLTLAADTGSTGKALEALVGNLTPDQLAEGKQ